MLFDLRGRGRRTTVRGIYLALAILMGSGLILFGVGTGVGGGGLFGGIIGNGSNNGGSVSNSEVKAALKGTSQRPTDPAAWATLIGAYHDSANQQCDAQTGTCSAGGTQDLTKLTQAWQRYLQLTKSPTADTARTSARAFQALQQYASAAKAWEIVTMAQPTEVGGFECLAVNAYAAKQTRVGELAAAKAVSLQPKAQRQVEQEKLITAKSSPQLSARGC